MNGGYAKAKMPQKGFLSSQFMKVEKTIGGFPRNSDYLVLQILLRQLK